MKKALSILLVAGMLTTAIAGMAAAADDETNPWRELPYYLSITGTVVSYEDLKSGLSIKIDDEYGNPAYLILSDKTVYPFETTAAVGDVVTGFYQANAPMIAIWPPQYNISVLVVGAPEDKRVVVDRFYEWEDHSEGYYIAQSGAFAFRISEDTEIILENGDDYIDGDLAGKRIVVIFDVSTRSIPELATARTLIVLCEDAVNLPDVAPPEELAPVGDPEIDASGWPILVDGVLVEAPAAYQTAERIVMVPLRVIAETLGFEVRWDAEARTVTLDDSIVLTIGDASYLVGETVIELADAPALMGGFTYVPLAFFRDILELPNAFAFEGQIEIHSDGDRME